ncbi:hypothetical protein EUTSA_v10012170mg [Eutrema salsugineum]|uniref:Uncharacterized protein n=1 Tax=Eutrema salsugineum TaxID=72664 RepID=V4MFA1_EUTSA|nr:hypothetical protein EUTSA_v10012170mg [Eutrema salsugineum]
MDSPFGHVGIGFLLIGLWHLFNNIKEFCLNPNTFSSSPWFPSSKLRYLELYSIMVSLSIMIVGQLFIRPMRHHPFDLDGTIPSSHLHTTTTKGLAFFASAAAFAQQIFLFHLHSADHMAIERLYHFPFQFVIFFSLITTLTTKKSMYYLMSIAMPKCFITSFVRSSSIAFQGVWFVVMGFMLCPPSLIPIGCFFHVEKYREMVRCSSQEVLHRAKSLINIEFSWLFVVFTIFIMTLYLILAGVYGR